MEARDRAALQAAIEELLRLAPTWNETVAAMLQAQPWEQVAAWAAGVCQVRNLHLRGWECPPCDTNSEVVSVNYGSRPSEVALLRRMLAAGVSRFDPSPLEALAAIERAA